MAQKKFTQYVDDHDGSPATVTVYFAVAGKGYETDLNDEHAAEFARDMEKWIGPARRSTTGLRRPVQLVSENVPETAMPAAPAPPLPRRRRSGTRAGRNQLQAV